MISKYVGIPTKEDFMRNYLEILKMSDLFKGINDSEITPLLSCLFAKEKHYKKGETIFLSGETIYVFGILLSGQVQVIKDDYYGNRSILANFGKGHLFGESFACAEIKAIPVSVISTSESQVLFIDCRKLSFPCSKACSFHSKLIHNMLNIISRKNISLIQKIEFTSKRTTREKLLAYLSAQAQKAHSSQFNIPFNRQELADYLSVDRSAMSAELSKLRDDNILKFHKNQFELL